MRVRLANKKLLAAVLGSAAVIIYLVLFALGLLPPFRGGSIFVAVIGEEGDQTVNAVQMLFDQVNQEGGINGKKIELMVFDDLNDADTALDIAKEIRDQDKALLVLGHAYSSTSIAAGEIYKDAEIPAITSSATALTVTQGNDWYFRVIFNNSLQATILASYVHHVLGNEIVSIIFDERAYGKSLAQAFEQEALAHGMEVRSKFPFDPRVRDTEPALAEIVEALSLVESPGAAFLAVQGDEAEVLVRSIRDLGMDPQFVGTDSIGGQFFVDELGDYTNGIYAAAPLIFDVANQAAQDFRRASSQQYGELPDWSAASNYDAATIAVQAIRAAQINGDSASLQDDRGKVREQLAGLNSPEQPFRGTTGAIYFDHNGDAVKSVPIGEFKNQRFISAPVQFQPLNETISKDELEQAIIEGHVVEAGGQPFDKAMVVYTGMEINKVRDISIRDSSYYMDFYVWFRSNNEFPVEGIEFTNAAAEIKLGEPIDQESTENAFYRLYREKGVFKGAFRLNDYPFDQQTLQVQFHHPEITREHLIFVRDDLGMPSSDSLLADFEERQALDGAEWDVNRLEFFQDTIEDVAGLGHPDLLSTQQSAQRSRFNLTIEIRRDVASYSVKNLIPLFLLVGLAYLMFFLPPDQVAVRIGIGVNVLLATAFFSVRLSNELPNIGYLVAMEYLFIGLYALALFGIFMAIVDYMVSQRGNAGQKKWEHRLMVASKIGYPIVVVGGVAAMGFFYLV